MSEIIQLDDYRMSKMTEKQLEKEALIKASQHILLLNKVVRDLSKRLSHLEDRVITPS